MLLRVHNDDLRAEHRRRLHATHDSGKASLVILLVTGRGGKRRVRLVAHNAAFVRDRAQRAHIVPPVIAVHRIVLVAEHFKKAHVKGVEARRFDHADGGSIAIDLAEKFRLR